MRSHNNNDAVLWALFAIIALLGTFIAFAFRWVNQNWGPTATAVILTALGLALFTAIIMLLSAAIQKQTMRGMTEFMHEYAPTAKQSAQISKVNADTEKVNAQYRVLDAKREFEEFKRTAPPITASPPPITAKPTQLQLPASSQTWHTPDTDTTGDIIVL